MTDESIIMDAATVITSLTDVIITSDQVLTLDVITVGINSIDGIDFQGLILTLDIPSGTAFGVDASITQNDHNLTVATIYGATSGLSDVTMANDHNLTLDESISVGVDALDNIVVFNGQIVTTDIPSVIPGISDLTYGILYILLPLTVYVGSGRVSCPIICIRFRARLNMKFPQPTELRGEYKGIPVN